MDRPIELTAESLWNEVAGRLKGALNETTYRTWFAEAEGAELSDDAFVLGVPNDFTREWIEGHFLGLIGAAVRDVTGQERRILLSVSERRRQLARSICFASLVSLSNIVCSSCAVADPRTTASTSSLNNTLRRSKFEEPTTDQTPSMTAVFECSTTFWVS